MCGFKEYANRAYPRRDAGKFGKEKGEWKFSVLIYYTDIYLFIYLLLLNKWFDNKLMLEKTNFN